MPDQQHTVLVAEDSTTVRHLVARILTRAGFRVVEAADGLDALALVLTERPQVALLDEHMPGCSGTELVRRIRSIPVVAETAVLVMTADDDRGAASAALAAGADDFLRKPCDPSELVARVRKAVTVHEREAELDRRSSTDPLTGLPNRRGMEPVLASLAAPAGSGTGLLVVDVDHFKQVNDTHGHEAGDEVLRAVAGRLAATASPATVARWGGEEFVVAGRCDDVRDVGRLGERVRRAVSAVPCEFVLDGEPRSIPVTVSVGAVFVAEGEGIERAVTAADAALYEAKGWGRNRVVLAVDGRLEPLGGVEADRAAPGRGPVPGPPAGGPVHAGPVELEGLQRFLRG